MYLFLDLTCSSLCLILLLSLSVAPPRMPSPHPAPPTRLKGAMPPPPPHIATQTPRFLTHSIELPNISSPRTPPHHLLPKKYTHTNAHTCVHTHTYMRCVTSFLSQQHTHTHIHTHTHTLSLSLWLCYTHTKTHTHMHTHLSPCIIRSALDEF